MSLLKQDRGIKVIGIVFIGMAVFTLIFNVMHEVSKITLINILNSSNSIFLFFSYLICGFGIIKHKLWAKYLCIFLSLWFFINNLALIFVTSSITKFAIICLSLIPLTVIYYLTRPSVHNILKI